VLTALRGGQTGTLLSLFGERNRKTAWPGRNIRAKAVVFVGGVEAAGIEPASYRETTRAFYRLIGVFDLTLGCWQPLPHRTLAR